MIDKSTNEPSGFGRIITSHGYFIDKLYKDGKANGFYREIANNGQHWNG